MSGSLGLANLVASPDARTRVGHRDGYALVQAACWGIVAGTAVAPAMLPIAHRLVRRLGVEIVHLHFPDPLSLVIAETLPRHLKLVVTWHSDVIRQRAALSLYQPLVDRLLRRASAVIGATRSHFEQSTQLASVPESRRRIIPFGIAPESIDNAASRSLGERLRATMENRPIVLGVGRHVYYKGFEVLIDAMRAVPDAVLVLCGHGELTRTLRDRVVSAGLDRRVVFAGQVTDDELAGWYQACDVFCMPSVERAECFGLVQLEAMACGKPIVVTRLGNGVNEVHADGVIGHAVPVGDAKALAAALEDLLADPAKRARMGRAAGERVRARFSRDRMRDATLALYREVTCAE